jgi:hypothetical protein
MSGDHNQYKFAPDWDAKEVLIERIRELESREWIGLTNDEICEVAEIDGADAWLFGIARAIEAKLREKNT